MNRWHLSLYRYPLKRLSNDFLRLLAVRAVSRLLLEATLPGNARQGRSAVADRPCWVNAANQLSEPASMAAGALAESTFEYTRNVSAAMRSHEYRADARSVPAAP